MRFKNEFEELNSLFSKLGLRNKNYKTCLTSKTLFLISNFFSIRVALIEVRELFFTEYNID